VATQDLLKAGSTRNNRLKKAPVQDPATPTDGLPQAPAAPAAEAPPVPGPRESGADAISAPVANDPAAAPARPEPELETAKAESEPAALAEPVVTVTAAPAVPEPAPAAAELQRSAPADVADSDTAETKETKPAVTSSAAPARQTAARREPPRAAAKATKAPSAPRASNRANAKGFTVYLSQSAIDAIGVYRDMKAAEEGLEDGGYNTGFVVVDAVNWWASLGNVDPDSPAEAPEPDLHEFCLRAVSDGITISAPGAMFAKTIRAPRGLPWQFTPKSGVLVAFDNAIAKFKRTEDYATSSNRRQLKVSPVIAELLVEFLSSTGLL
jgi:hypothetical protein